MQNTFTTLSCSYAHDRSQNLDVVIPAKYQRNCNSNERWSFWKTARVCSDASQHCRTKTLYWDIRPIYSMSPSGFTVLTTLAGEPIATDQSGISRVTTDEAPMVQPGSCQHKSLETTTDIPLPMVTPGRMTVFAPIQQSSPILTGLVYSIRSLRLWTSLSCVAA